MFRYEVEVPDIEKYFPLYLETGWNEIQKLSKEEALKAIENSFVSVCAYDSDTLVGFGRVVSDGVTYACLYDVIVKPSYHKKGIGSETVKRLVSYCKEMKIRSIHLVAAEGVEEFYKKIGFEVRTSKMPGMRYVGMDKN